MRGLLAHMILLGVLCIGLESWANGPGSKHILRVSDHMEISFPEMLEDLKKVRLIFVGELHDSQSHHQFQLQVIRALQEADVPLAVGLEMFRKKDQAYLDQWIAGNLDTEDFQRHYYENWNIEWSLYSSIFLFAREKRIPMIGLNVPREITRQAAREGFASLDAEQLGELAGVSCQVDATYEAFIRRALGEHGHGGMSFTYFCEAQMVWDAAMAWNLVRFLRRNPRTTVVVLAGSGHAWKRGIPTQVRRRSSFSYRVILPEIRDRPERGKVTLEDADYLWVEPE